MIAIELPVTIIPRASERNFSGTNRTAIGEAIDQKTACAHATPIRDAISIPKLPEKADSSWHPPNSASVPINRRFISIRQTSSIRGRERSMTTHA